MQELKDIYNLQIRSDKMKSLNNLSLQVEVQVYRSWEWSFKKIMSHFYDGNLNWIEWSKRNGATNIKKKESSKTLQIL